MADKEFMWVRSIFGKYPDGKKWYNHIPTNGINRVIQEWHANQAERGMETCSPSIITTCPRVVWLANHGVEPTKVTGWGMKQRMMLGRVLENTIAEQLRDAGLLLWHWKDDPGVEVDSFEFGIGTMSHFKGTPDLLLSLDDIPTISDAKTSRSDSFGYVAIQAKDLLRDGGWNKYRIQVNAYYMLCHANRDWFIDRDLPLPQQCHLFSYALDDGIVRREVVWKPTEEDREEVIAYAIRYNTALASNDCPDCTCTDGDDNFDVKFCKYGEVEAGDKMATSCCDDNLIKEAKKG